MLRGGIGTTFACTGGHIRVSAAPLGRTADQPAADARAAAGAAGGRARTIEYRGIQVSSAEPHPSGARRRGVFKGALSKPDGPCYMRLSSREQAVPR